MSEAGMEMPACVCVHGDKSEVILQLLCTVQQSLSPYSVVAFVNSSVWLGQPRS